MNPWLLGLACGVGGVVGLAIGLAAGVLGTFWVAYLLGEMDEHVAAEDPPIPLGDGLKLCERSRSRN